MGLSAADIVMIGTTDSVAPGKGTITEARQFDNEHLLIGGTNPNQDADGANLSGLSGRYIVYIPTSEGINPFDGLTSQEILDFAGAASVFVALNQENDRGQPWSQLLDIKAVGPTYIVAIIYTDDEGVIA